MTDILRNMLRRKVRSGLTILGIVIGVFALTVMGAMAEKMTLLMNGGATYYGGHVTINPATSDFSAPLSTSKVGEISRVPGVAAVVPIIGLPLKSGSSTVSLGMPDMIIGGWSGNAAMDKYEKFKLTAAQGQLPASGERGVVAVGSTIAREFKLHAGDTFRVRGRPFLVKALIETTMTAPDNSVMMSIADAQKIMYAGLPPMLKGAVQPGDLASQLSVYPKPDVSGDTLARRIKAARIGDIKVVSPSEYKKSFDQGAAIFNLIVMGAAIIAVIVGALSVINTMAMSVAERVKEIGLKKAIGAHTSQIMREYLVEASAIGLIGGLVGLGLGTLLVQIINGATAGSGTQIFAVTTRLAIGAVIFATVLGAFAGFFPALRAARLNPVVALRSE